MLPSTQPQSHVPSGYKRAVRILEGHTKLTGTSHSSASMPQNNIPDSYYRVLRAIEVKEGEEGEDAGKTRDFVVLGNGETS
jgi:hypothetical protein